MYTATGHRMNAVVRNNIDLFGVGISLSVYKLFIRLNSLYGCHRYVGAFAKQLSPSHGSGRPYIESYASFRLRRRSWVTATILTVIVDVTLRKPVSVLAKAGIHTIRDAAQAQDAPFTQNNMAF